MCLPGRIVYTLGKPFLTPQECKSRPVWSRNSYLEYLWPLGSEKVATVLYKGPLRHNSIRIPREVRLGRQNCDFSAFSRGPRRDTLKVNTAPEIIYTKHVLKKVLESPRTARIQASLGIRTFPAGKLDFNNSCLLILHSLLTK